MSTPSMLGSPEWADNVFSTAPVDLLVGRTRWTQSHAHYSEPFQKRIAVQGRKEYCALLALEYLAILGVVKRIKPQPFETTKSEFGRRIRPDFLVEALVDGKSKLFVIEVKSKRFLTREVQIVLEENRKRFAEHGLTYLVWTDEEPLNHPVRHNLIELRGSITRNIDAEEINGFMLWLKDRPITSLEEIYDAGFDINLARAAVWKRAAFMQITQPLKRTSRLTHKLQEDYRAIFLKCKNQLNSWWEEL